MEIVLNTITGFESNAPLILIKKGRATFYLFKNEQQKNITFNLPKGVYNTDCEIFKLKRPLVYIHPSLPSPEKDLPIAEKIDIRVGKNPNKATVDKRIPTLTKILIDESMLENPCECEFILFHELGHYFYRTEWKCDLFSAAEMLKRGFNPSQIIFSSICGLSNKQDERKDILFNFLKQTKAQ